MNKISRKGFIKIAAAAAMSGVTAGALAACNSASGSASTSGAAGQYIPPAIATGPFISITNDIIGMMMYMGITVLLA